MKLAAVPSRPVYPLKLASSSSDGLRRRHSMVKCLVALMTLSSCFSTPLLAQSPPASTPTSAPLATQQSQVASSPAQSLGMFAYPEKQRAALVLLPRISASTRNRIDPDPVIGLMRAAAPRCAVVCGLSCIRPWAPFNGTAFPMPYEGGLFECLRSGPVTTHPSGALSTPRLQAAPGRTFGQ